MFRLGRSAFFIAMLMFSFSVFVRAEYSLPNEPSFALSAPQSLVNSQAWGTPNTGINMPDEFGLTRGNPAPAGSWEPPGDIEGDSEDSAIGEKLGNITQNLDDVEADSSSGDSEDAILGPEVKAEEQSECADQEDLEDESVNVVPHKCVALSGEGSDFSAAPTVWGSAGGDQAGNFSYFRVSSTQLYQAGQDPWLNQLKQADVSNSLVLGLMPSHGLSLASFASDDPFRNSQEESLSLTMADDVNSQQGEDGSGSDQVFQTWMKWKQTRALPYGWSSRSSLR